MAKQPTYGIVYDFETMGQDERTCAILDCSICHFSWQDFITKPFTFESALQATTTFKLDLKSQRSVNKYTIEADTIEFWKQQPAEIRRRILPSADDLTLDQFADQILTYLQDRPTIDYWWSRSANFDPVIMFRVMRDTSNYTKFAELAKFYWIRDTRSYFDGKFGFEADNNFVPIADQQYWEANFQLHNSAHDVVADLLRLQTVYRAEKDLPQVNR